MIKYNLTRSRRKTIAIYVRGDTVDVRAPLRTPKSYIDEFVLSKQAWIEKQLDSERERIFERESFCLNYGDSVIYLGKPYVITKSASGKIGISADKFYVPDELPPERIKSACVEIYKILAKNDLTMKTFSFAKEMSVYPSSVRINSAKSRWGSCSADKSINYSWRLIMADSEVVDYVVVHELAHLIELNHSKRFWAVVERVLPDYRERQDRLKELQLKLNAEKWEE